MASARALSGRSTALCRRWSRSRPRSRRQCRSAEERRIDTTPVVQGEGSEAVQVTDTAGAIVATSDIAPTPVSPPEPAPVFVRYDEYVKQEPMAELPAAAYISHMNLTGWGSVPLKIWNFFHDQQNVDKYASQALQVVFESTRRRTTKQELEMMGSAEEGLEAWEGQHMDVVVEDKVADSLVIYDTQADNAPFKSNGRDSKWEIYIGRIAWPLVGQLSTSCRGCSTRESTEKAYCRVAMVVQYAPVQQARSSRREIAGSARAIGAGRGQSLCTRCNLTSAITIWKISMRCTRFSFFCSFFLVPSFALPANIFQHFYCFLFFESTFSPAHSSYTSRSNTNGPEPCVRTRFKQGPA
ncbi:hypothetical protein DL89DRAFT_173670 [Linderina pennispora]|uniref:Uncharacterized protein n=1 Tax=Linderina pennispora TaxID=61395 RepID=A0A1Y1W7T9_9FUNG|nr:uncharacterized protein DL89DRAFT_173670 [Linderina pennispora]ORX69234.1 hypothetical protein DL89DRAFT_173670 [Linderina pennispora]